MVHLMRAGKLIMLYKVCINSSQMDHLAAIPAGQVDWRAKLGCI